MQEICFDYTPTIRFITDEKIFSLCFDNYTIIESEPFNYEILFDFLNYDLTAFSEQLSIFYNLTDNNSSDFQDYFNKISEQVKKIFKITKHQYLAVIVVAFIEADYTEYIRHKYHFAESTIERNELKNKYLIFLKQLYISNSYPKFQITSKKNSPKEDLLLERYFNDLFEVKIAPFSHIQGPVLEFTPYAKPPYLLNKLKDKLRLYLSGSIDKTESYRLRYQDTQTRLEYLTLVASALSKQSFQLSFSEKNALSIYESKKYEEAKKKEIEQKNGNDKIYEKKEKTKCPSPCIPPYPLDTEHNIALDLSYIPRKQKEIAYSFEHLESILILEMFYFIRSSHYVFQCPRCGKYFESTRIQFFCTPRCRDAHRQYVISSCPPWKEIEKIRKKIGARAKNQKHTHSQTFKIMKPFEDILSRYKNEEIDVTTALAEIDKANQEIDYKYRYDKIYGIKEEL